LNALIKRAIEAATVGQSGVGHGGSLNRQGSGEAENVAGITSALANLYQLGCIGWNPF
jgi:hypothetical protein